MRTAVALITLTALPALAEDSRGLGAHEHGAGAFNIAIEGSSVLMELEAPGADIVGFEHKAESAEDRAAIDAAVARLAKPLELFVLSDAAGCAVTSASVELVAEGGDHGDHEEHGHGEHEHEHEKEAHDEHKHDDHAHEDHGDEKHDDHDHGDHAHGEHHDNDGHGEEAGHTEFHAEYALTCADPNSIKAIDFAYFTVFPGARELDVQLVSEQGAKGFEVEREDPRLDLTGAI